MIEHWLKVPDEAPETWDGFPWPEWIPAEQRKQIEEFWSVAWGGGPRAWLRDHEVQKMPYTGERITTADIFGRARDEIGNPVDVTGRYIHAWNNMGRLMLEDGTVKTVSPSYRSAARYRAAEKGSVPHE